ncbi:methyltransferase family protein [Allosalinactinospora lopnorensis]|uniref:methyltransferase family protein n=1 Tax=Allosalinactinospora lopnorensis TaxID=1352348 RepID=UPI000696DEA1|nr:isoprenylcysteine carboxylmethyltransferase family protein [Allosalinactinospora lopnorensis]
MSSLINRRFPAVLLVAGITALACVLARELAALPVPVADPGESRTFGVDGLALVRATMVAGYLLWLVLEARITFADGRSPGTGGRDGSDATVYVYGLARVLTVGAAVCAGSYWTGVTPAVLAGGAVFACGVTLRLAAVRRLGRLYSHRVRLVADHPIVRSGCYRFVRHPAYLG